MELTSEDAASSLCSCARRRAGGIAVASSAERGLSVSRCGGVTGSRRHAHAHARALLLCGLFPSLPPVLFLRELGVRMAMDRERQTDTGPGGPRAGTEGFRLVRAPGPSLVSCCLFPLFSHGVEFFFLFPFFIWYINKENDFPSAGESEVASV